MRQISFERNARTDFPSGTKTGELKPASWLTLRRCCFLMSTIQISPFAGLSSGPFIWLGVAEMPAMRSSFCQNGRAAAGRAPAERIVKESRQYKKPVDLIAFILSERSSPKFRAEIFSPEARRNR